jgi:hypothetical protein
MLPRLLMQPLPLTQPLRLPLPPTNRQAAKKPAFGPVFFRPKFADATLSGSHAGRPIFDTPVDQTIEYLAKLLEKSM